MKSNKVCSVVRATVGVAAIVFAGIVVSACSSLNQQQTSSASFSVDQLISAEIADFLNHSVTDTSASFAQSPWGNNVILFAKAPYYSASGAQCRQLIVESTLDQRTGLACTQDKQRWYKVRALVAGNTQ